VPDDRPLEDPPEQVGRLEQDLADLRAMVNARMARRPTGDMELAFRPTPKDGTLVCNGQAVSRAQYPDLYQWAVDQGLMGSAFGVGDGSTTFTVPDVKDRFLAAAGSSISVGSTGGQATRTLTQNELPSHTHTVSVTQHPTHDHTFSGTGSATGSAGGHTHGFTTSGVGDHGGHTSGTSNVTQSGSGVTLPSNYSGGAGGHSHSGGTDNQGSHTHSVNVNGDVGTGAAMTHTASAGNTGTGAAFDTRPPYIGVTVLVWV
jgi:microcystin-dependent protein